MRKFLFKTITLVSAINYLRVAFSIIHAINNIRFTCSAEEKESSDRMNNLKTRTNNVTIIKRKINRKKLFSKKNENENE